MSKFIIVANCDGSFHFELDASSGENLLVSKNYKTNEECDRKMMEVLDSSRNDLHFNRTKTRDGKFSFVLKDVRGKKLGTGQSYVTENGRERAIRIFREEAENASIELE